MEETLYLILRGCGLARKLESDLPNIANQTSSLSDSCEEIIGFFSRAKERLNSQNLNSYTQMIFRQNSPEFLTPEMDFPNIQNQQLRGSGSPESKLEMVEAKPAISTSSSGMGVLELGLEMDYHSSRGAEIYMQPRPGGFPVVEVVDRGKAPAPVVQKTRKSSSSNISRVDETEKHVVRVAATRGGNTDLPPDDGFTWRKYGQKEILGSNFPRSYYRCTHKNFHGCEAKKRVQRLNNDPYMYEVTYCGRHTCQSSIPIMVTSVDKQEKLEITDLSSTPTHFGSWFPGDLEVGLNVGTSKEPETTLIDFADAMFNSGSSSNSMDAIFSSNHET